MALHDAEEVLAQVDAGNAAIFNLKHNGQEQRLNNGR